MQFGRAIDAQPRADMPSQATGLRSSERPRLESLDGLRGIASLNVAIGHFLFSFLGFTAYYLFENMMQQQKWQPRYAVEAVLAQTPLTLFYNGTFAVSIFFVMSGFVLTQRFLRDDSKTILLDAAIKRYPRLVLPCAAALLFAWSLQRLGLMLTDHAVQLGASGWVSTYYAKPVSVFNLVGTMIAGAPVLGRTDLDAPLWSIRIELIGSFLLYAGVALFGPRRKWMVTAFVLLFAVNIFPQSGAIADLLAMAAGFLLIHAYSYLRRAPRFSLALVVLGLLLGAYDYSPRFAWLTGIPLPDLSPYLWNLPADRKTLFETLGAIALVAGVLGSRSVTDFLSMRVFQFLGRISFSLYLLHSPLLYSLGLGTIEVARGVGLSYPAAVLSAFLVTFPVLLVLSSAFARWVDAPATRLAARVAKRLSGRKEALLPPGSNALPRDTVAEPTYVAADLGAN